MASETAHAREIQERVEHELLPIPDEARTSTGAAPVLDLGRRQHRPDQLGARRPRHRARPQPLADASWSWSLGNVIGMAVFGFFVLMGQRTGGQPDGARPRAPFGRRGAYLPAAIQGLIAIGWCAINTWIVLDLVVALFGELGIDGGTRLKITVALVIMALQVSSPPSASGPSPPSRSGRCRSRSSSCWR